MSGDPLDPEQGLGRRTFLQAGGLALLCTIGDKTVRLSGPGDAKRADAAAAAVKRPAPIKSKDPVDALRFDTPQPQPGGQAIEYWIEVRAVNWTIVPSRRDDWHGIAIPASPTSPRSSTS